MDCNTIYCSNATTTDTTVVLVPNRDIKTLEDRGCYRLVICCNATATANLPVNIQVNGVSIPVLCKAGDEVYANMLEKRKSYTIMYGSDNSLYTNGQFVIQNNLCPRAASVPSTTTTSDDSTEVNPNMRKK